MRVLCGAVLACSWLSWSSTTFDARVTAQSAAAAKRPLSYDAYDAWWSIQGTTLSRDGQWLAYALRP